MNLTEYLSCIGIRLSPLATYRRRKEERKMHHVSTENLKSFSTGNQRK